MTKPGRKGMKQRKISRNMVKLQTASKQVNLQHRAKLQNKSHLRGSRGERPAFNHRQVVEMIGRMCCRCGGIYRRRRKYTDRTIEWRPGGD